MSGFTVWLTGLPCSGKSTLARALERQLVRRGLKVFVLDGDEVRTRLTKGLGFSREDRDENIRRISYVARAVTLTGGAAIACAISPFRGARGEARREIGRFIEVFVDAAVEECARRDVKGMYKKAFSGEIKNFTGVSDPYEAPEHPEVHLHTDREDEAASVRRIVDHLVTSGFLGSAGLPAPHGGTLTERWTQASPPAARLDIDGDLADEVYNLSTGAFSPLGGFLGRAELESVLAAGRLPDGTPWTVPIVLPLAAERAASLPAEVTLAYDGRPVAILRVKEAYPWDREAFAKAVFGTTSEKHPGVARTVTWGDRFVGGEVLGLASPASRLTKWTRTPRETRAAFAELGWRSVAAFQTRNVPHLCHEGVQKIALAGVDGLFVQPLAGSKKPGDFKDEVIFASYEALVAQRYPPKRAYLSALHLPMRYAGPKEAIFHAIVRKNFGASHFIVGRDHAGVGTFYDPYAAHRIFDEYPDLGIEPLRYTESFWCEDCGGVSHDKACTHGPDRRRNFSGTRLRKIVEGGEDASDLLRPEVAQVLRSHPEPFV